MNRLFASQMYIIGGLRTNISYSRLMRYQSTMDLSTRREKGICPDAINYRGQFSEPVVKIVFVQ